MGTRLSVHEDRKTRGRVGLTGVQQGLVGVLDWHPSIVHERGVALVVARKRVSRNWRRVSGQALQCRVVRPGVGASQSHTCQGGSPSPAAPQLPPAAWKVGSW
jgi:hypothetical protein